MKYVDLYKGIFLSDTNNLSDLFSPKFNQIIDEAKNLSKCLEKIRADGSNEEYVQCLTKGATEDFLNYFLEGKRPNSSSNEN